MPLTICCKELQPGMRLAEALIASDGRVLLSGGKVLSEADITALVQRHPEMPLRVVDPVLDELVDFEDDAPERSVAQTVQAKIARTISDVGERFSRHSSLGSVNFAGVQSSIAEVVEYLTSNSISAALLSRTLSSGFYLSDHSGGVFYLSMILGSAVRDYIAGERTRQRWARELQRKYTLNLTPLGLGAMFADIGMLPLQHLYQSPDPLSKADREAVREHPHAGAELLPEGFDSVARMIVRTHHENYDGSGYPSKLSRENLHVFSRIVRIADAYDAATCEQVYREALSPARALWEMSVGRYSRFYDPVLMKVFTRLIQPFPIGAKLRLLDGRYAVVARYNRQNPFLPTVIVAFDAEDRPIPRDRLQPPVSLAQRRDLRVRSFGSEELSYLYASRLIEDPAPVHQDLQTMFQAAFP